MDIVSAIMQYLAAAFGFEAMDWKVSEAMDWK